MVLGPLILPESTGGEAWGCQDSREGGVQVSVVLASTCWCPNLLLAMRTLRLKGRADHAVHQPEIRARPCWFADRRSCPRTLVAKRGDVRIREKEGFKCPRFCEHRSTREPKAVVCPLGTLNTDCGKAFSLLRFFVAEGPRNEVPPRTVANSDKKFSQNTTRANVSSSNPAPTPTTAPTPRPKPRPSANANNWLIDKNIANT